MKGHYERTDYHSKRIKEGIAGMAPEAKERQRCSIKQSFVGRSPRVLLDGLYDLWLRSGCLGYRSFGDLAISKGYPDKNYFYTVKVFEKYMIGK